jgi:hypothetical protein
LRSWRWPLTVTGKSHTADNPAPLYHEAYE